jgi:hypothetical protein
VHNNYLHSPLSVRLFTYLSPNISFYGHLASIQHTGQSRLLRRLNRQSIHTLNLNPHLRICAPITLQRRFPRIRALIPLALIHIIRHSNQLRVCQIVCELLPLGTCPGAGAGFPGVGERDHVVDVDVGGGGPRGAIEGRVPGSRGSGAVGAGYDVGAITLENGFAGVAGARDCDPVVEEVAV